MFEVSLDKEMVPSPQNNLETAVDDSTILLKAARPLRQLLLAVKAPWPVSLSCVAASSGGAEAPSGFLFWYTTPMQSCMACRAAAMESVCLPYICHATDVASPGSPVETI